MRLQFCRNDDVRTSASQGGEFLSGCSMPFGHAETRNMVFHKRPDVIASYRMKNLVTRTESDKQNDQPTKRRDQDRAPQLVAEWQDRGLETLAGHGLWKLRLALAPAESAMATSAAA